MSRVASLALELDGADRQINIVMRDDQALALVQVAPHQRCHALPTGIHICLGLDAEHLPSAYLPCTAERLGLALSYRHMIALGKCINHVKTQIVSSMTIALSRVAQPHNDIHTSTTISVHDPYTVTTAPRALLPLEAQDCAPYMHRSVHIAQWLVLCRNAPAQRAGVMAVRSA